MSRRIIIIDDLDTGTDLGCISAFIMHQGHIIFTCFLTILLLIISPLHNSLLGHAFEIERFMNRYVVLGYAAIVLIVCILTAKCNVSLRIVFGLVQAAATAGALWLFFHIIFSYDGSFPIALLNFATNELYGLPYILRIVLYVLLCILSYLLFYSPIILLAILYRICDKYNDNSTMSIYYLHGYFRSICFFAYMFGCVLFHPAYRVYDLSIAKDGWAFVAAVIAYIPVGIFSHYITKGD